MSKYGTFKYGEDVYGDKQRWIYYRKQKDLDNNTKIAYINYDDLNRIETRIEELSELLNLSLNVKTNWQKQGTANGLENIPTSDELSRIHNNIISILNAHYADVPEIPDSFDNIDIFDMNNIEKVLHDVFYDIKRGV